MAKAPKNFASVARGYANLWKKCELVKRSEANKIADRIIAALPKYTPITKATGVPEWAIGILHYRESNLNFGTYLGNGQTLGRKTTIVPKGRGPFLGEGAFVRGAIDAIELQGFQSIKDWSAARFLYESERFNGFGYYMKGINSPYVWGGTNLQQRGKYVRDGVFDPNVMDTQLGSAAILKALCERSPAINAQVNKEAVPEPVEPKPDVPIVVTPPPIILPPAKPDLGPAIKHIEKAIMELNTSREIMEAIRSGKTAAEIKEEREGKAMSNTHTPPTVEVPVKPAMNSKINWAQIASMASMAVAAFTGVQMNLDPEAIAITVGTVGAVWNGVTMILRTWFTKSVTTAAAQK